MKKKDKVKLQRNNPVKKPRISLCMIVKNEEECLKRCLDSVKDFVDEIIVVDTGSTDRTVEIAESYGARLYHHPWENDFSKHRNQSISYATGDWILQLDADEELFADDGPKIRDTIATGRADYYFFRFYDLKKDGAVHGIFNLVRLFRNGMGMYFTQKVHNQLQFRGKGALSSIRVNHYGYDLSKEKMEAKHNRTTTLLKEMLAENPEDAYSRHQLASSYSMHREFDKVIEHGEMVLELMRRKGLKGDFIITTFYTVAQAYQALGNLDASERICLEALEYFSKHLDACHVLASIYFKKRSPDLCRAMSLRYLQIYDEFEKNPSLIGNFFCHSAAKRHEIYLGLAFIHFLERDFDAADVYFRQSFEDTGLDPAKAETICRFYLEQRHDEKALQWLTIACEASLNTGNLSAASIGKTAYDVAEAFCRRGQWQLAEPALQLALQIAPAAFDHNRFDRLLPKNN
jgi:glycosyltransferase involved in cell wall biosynthesis